MGGGDRGSRQCRIIGLMVLLQTPRSSHLVSIAVMPAGKNTKRLSCGITRGIMNGNIYEQLHKQAMCSPACWVRLLGYCHHHCCAAAAAAPLPLMS
jgi:hypothetical protein